MNHDHKKPFFLFINRPEYPSVLSLYIGSHVEPQKKLKLKYSHAYYILLFRSYLYFFITTFKHTRHGHRTWLCDKKIEPKITQLLLHRIFFNSSGFCVLNITCLLPVSISLHSIWYPREPGRLPQVPQPHQVTTSKCRQAVVTCGQTVL